MCRYRARGIFGPIMVHFFAAGPYNFITYVGIYNFSPSFALIYASQLSQHLQSVIAAVLGIGTLTVSLSHRCLFCIAVHLGHCQDAGVCDGLSSSWYSTEFVQSVSVYQVHLAFALSLQLQFFLAIQVDGVSGSLISFHQFRHSWNPCSRSWSPGGLSQSASPL